MDPELALTMSMDCVGNNSIIKTTHKLKPHTVHHGARDQFFQALSPFFCRGGAWVQGYQEAGTRVCVYFNQQHADMHTRVLLCSQKSGRGLGTMPNTRKC